MNSLTTPITRTTELKPSDVIINREGVKYKIDSFFGGKTNFRIYQIDTPNQHLMYLFVSKEALIINEWQKLERSELKKVS